MDMKRVRVIFSLFVCWLPLFAGPLTKSHSQGKYSDAEIEATIKAKLGKSKIGQDGFQIHVKDGVATWTGTTNVMQHKGAATRMAKTAGAIHVTNNIKISDDAAQKGKGAAAEPPRHVQVKPAAAVAQP
jgi:osmotically-inducible protein OsmY